MAVSMHSCGMFPCIKHTLNRLLRWLHTLESALKMCSVKMPSFPAGRSSGSLWQRRFNLIAVAHQVINPSKLPFELIFFSQNYQFHSFLMSSAMSQSVFFHMTVAASFPVSPPTVGGSHDFLLFYVLPECFMIFVPQNYSHGISLVFLFGPPTSSHIWILFYIFPVVK